MQKATETSSGMDSDTQSLMLSTQDFHQQHTSPTLQGALKDGSREAVVSYDMPEPCKFLSLYSCQTMFLSANQTVELASHLVTRLTLKVGDGYIFLCFFFQSVQH